MFGKGDEVLLSTMDEFKQKKSLDIDLEDNQLKNALPMAQIIDLLKKIQVKQIFVYKDQKPDITASAKSPVIFSHFIDEDIILTTKVYFYIVF